MSESSEKDKNPRGFLWKVGFLLPRFRGDACLRCLRNFVVFLQDIPNFLAIYCGPALPNLWQFKFSKVKFYLLSPTPKIAMRKEHGKSCIGIFYEKYCVSHILLA